MTSFNIINEKVFEFHEFAQKEHRRFTTISYGEILDYELINERLLKSARVKQIIELDKYLKGENYLSVERTFTRPIPDGIGAFIDTIRQKEGKEPISF